MPPSDRPIPAGPSGPSAVDDPRLAIVGLSCRLPGAAGIDQFWNLIREGRTAIRRFSDLELADAGVSEEAAADEAFLPCGADVADPGAFDAAFFGFTPEEARLTDPQQRLFLECAWSALEDAATLPADHGGRIGVFGASGWSTYLFNNIMRSSEHAGLATSKPVMIANDKDFLCTRVSYRLNLCGPSFTVQSACSSSLLAVHLAGQALRAGECEVAVAGGVYLTLPQTAGYHYTDDSTYSRDGRCRPFDRGASGTVMSNGCAVVVLTRLADALARRRHVYAVIAASAVTNDGAAKIGYVAPSVVGQSAAMRAALAASGLAPAEVGYIEAHGTGTVLGDSLEVRALSAIYSAGGGKAAGGNGTLPCAIGSVKANVGHMGMASGVTGLVKLALVLDRGVIPPQAGFDEPHAQLALGRTRFVVPRTARPAPELRVAAINSMGGGGTNVHCLLTPAPTTARPAASPGPYLIAVSAREEAALRDRITQLRDHLSEPGALRLDDVAWTLVAGRAWMAYRWAARVDSIPAARAALDRYLAGEVQVTDPLAGAWTGESPPPLEMLGDFRGDRAVPLPTYPFRRDRHWIDADRPGRLGGPVLVSGSR